MTREEGHRLIEHLERVCEAVGEALSAKQMVAMLGVVAFHVDAPNPDGMVMCGDVEKIF